MKRLSFIMGMLIIVSFAITACGQATNKSVKPLTGKGTVQVLYFHGSQRCATCRAVEAKTIELIDDEYAQAQKDGKIVFKSIDFSEPDGEAIADRYKVAWSSLILDKDGTTVDLTDMGFRYARTEPETFKANLKQELDKMLR